MGLTLGLAATQIALPLSRIIPQELLQASAWHGLYLIELGLSLASLGGVLLVRLTPQPRVQVFAPFDFVSFVLLAGGLGLLGVVLSFGRIVWWTDAPWLGWCLVGAIILLTTAILIGLHRRQPLIDLRWLSTSSMVRFAVAIILFRVVLSEQSVGALGFMAMLGMTNDQMHDLFLVVLFATAAGFITSAFVIGPKTVRPMGLAALLLIAAASWYDSYATNLTRPADLYLSQGLMAFAGALFLPSAMLAGFSQAITRGPLGIVSFAALFSIAQNLGGLLASAALGTFVTIREKFHSNLLASAITLGDPQVVQRMRQLAGAYGRVIGDRVLLTAEGQQLLAKQVTREAYVLAYNDLFLLICLLALGTFLWLGTLFWLAARRERQAAKAMVEPATS